MKDIKLFKGDCLELLKDIPDGSVDMVLTDPPYGTTACKWDTVIDLDKMWLELKRVIKPNGVIVMTATEPFTSVLCVSNIRALREKLVWVKHKPSNFACGKFMHLKYHEDIVVFAEKKPIYNPQMQPRKSKRLEQMQKGNSRKWNTTRSDGNEVSLKTQYESKSWNDYNSELSTHPLLLKYQQLVVTLRKK